MLTTSERRGLSLLVLVFALGAARDLWTWHRLGRHQPGPPLPGSAAPPIAGSAPVRSDSAGIPGAAAAVVDGAEAEGAGGPIDVNRASAEELDRLPGIGPVLAGRILEHRRRHGPFRDADELLAVPGIGPRLLERLRPRVRTGSARPAPAASPRAGAGPEPSGH